MNINNTSLDHLQYLNDDGGGSAERRLKIKLKEKVVMAKVPSIGKLDLLEDEE